MSTDIVPEAGKINRRKSRRRIISGRLSWKFRMANDRDGISNIVTSIMMLGIVFTILGMVLTVYVPVWAKGLESGHMEDVSDAFIDLKSTIDTQIAQGDTGTKMSTRVVLGTEGGPLLGLGQTTGNIQYQPDRSMMSVFNENDNFEKYGTGRGRVQFQSNNIYFVDQDYIYENGAVIMDQDGSRVMKVEPNFYIDNVSGTTSVSMTLITLQGDLDSVGGIKSQTIQTNLLSVNKDTVLWGKGANYGSGKNITITINTSYPKVWHEYFKDLLSNRSRLDPVEYSIPAPISIPTSNDRDLWLVRVNVRDVNSFTTTIAYMDIQIV